MITLLQNSSMREHHDEINALGFAGAIDKYPAIRAAMNAIRFGSDKFDSKDLEFWSKVAEIDTTYLDEAYEIHNRGIEEKITRFDDQHSLSVGDILFDGTHYFMCNSRGFGKIAI